MMEKEKTIEIIKNYLISKNIKKASLFGSFVREDFGPKSDIDILFEPFPHMNLFDLIHMEDDLKKRTKRKIDLMEYDGIKLAIRDEVLAYAVPIL
ncbi:MAG: nucleotidyltransferase family protein [Cytophagales bacterium]